MKFLTIKSDLAFLSLALVLPINGLLSIYHAHFNFQYYFFLRQLVLIPFVFLTILICVGSIGKAPVLKKKYLMIIFLFFLLIVSLMSITIHNMNRSSQFIDNIGRNAVIENLNVFLKYIIYFIIGINLRLDRKYKYFTISVLLALIFSVFIYTEVGSFSLNKGSDYMRRVPYLFLGDSFAIWSILSISFVKKNINIYVILFICLVASYIIGSRSAFYFLFTSFFCFFYIRTNNKVFLLLASMTVLILILLSCITYNISIEDNRMLSLLILEDESLSVRNNIMRFSLQDLKSHWIAGEFAAPVLNFGSFGAYIHNYLSLWNQFGLFPFLIAVSLIYLLVIDMIKKVFLHENIEFESHSLFFILSSIFLLLEIIFARSYVYPYIWLCIGILATQGKTITNTSRTA